MTLFICLFIIFLPQENISTIGNISILFISVLLGPNGMPSTEQELQISAEGGGQRKEEGKRKRGRVEVGDLFSHPMLQPLVPTPPDPSSLHHLPQHRGQQSPEKDRQVSDDNV